MVFLLSLVVTTGAVSLLVSVSLMMRDAAELLRREFVGEGAAGLIPPPSSSPPPPPPPPSPAGNAPPPPVTRGASRLAAPTVMLSASWPMWWSWVKKAGSEDLRAAASAPPSDTDPGATEGLSTGRSSLLSGCGRADDTFRFGAFPSTPRPSSSFKTGTDGSSSAPEAWTEDLRR